MELHKEFPFEAAHHLSNVLERHKSRRLHGQSFRVSILVEGPVDRATDYADIKQAFTPFIDELDGPDNPTSENLPIWIWNCVKSGLPLLKKIYVYNSGYTYRGEHADAGFAARIRT